MNKTITVELTGPQIDLFRSVMFEYFAHNETFDSTEEQTRLELDTILADAANEYFSNFIDFFKNIEV
jgi:hypothetical protein